MSNRRRQSGYHFPASSVSHDLVVTMVTIPFKKKKEKKKQKKRTSLLSFFLDLTALVFKIF